MRHLGSAPPGPPALSTTTTRKVTVQNLDGLTAVDLFVLTERLRSERCPAEGHKVTTGPTSISVSWEVKTP